MNVGGGKWVHAKQSEKVVCRAWKQVGAIKLLGGWKCGVATYFFSPLHVPPPPPPVANARAHTVAESLHTAS